MPYPPKGLNEHRTMLGANPSRFTEDKERAIQNWVKHAWESARRVTSLSKKQSVPILKDMALLVWEAQGGVPFFNFGEVERPVCWNRPQDGMKNYIRYEIGHLNPRSNGGGSEPENLCFQSARCNQHIQSSLPIDEVMGFYFETNEEVAGRLESLKRLHSSQRWVDLRILVFEE